MHTTATLCCRSLSIMTMTPRDPRLLSCFWTHSIFLDSTASLHPLKSHRMTGGGRDAIKSFHQSVISSWQISTIAALTLSLFQFLISELHFVLTASVCAKSGHVTSSFQPFATCVKTNMCARSSFFLWCIKTLNPEVFFERARSNIPNISRQQTADCGSWMIF